MRYLSEKQCFFMTKNGNSINEELTKSEVESIVSNRLSSAYDTKEFKKAVKEITAQVIEDLYRTLWNRSSTWKGGVTR